MTEINERILRSKVRTWFKNIYKDKLVTEPVILHDLNMTVTEYLKKNFFGKELSLILDYDKMYVRPDIIALVRLRTKHLALVIAECKVGLVRVSDFRQALDYARVCKSYQAYLVFHGKLSNEVKRRLRVMDNVYEGYNSFSRLVRKFLHVVKYHGNMLFEFVRY